MRDNETRERRRGEGNDNPSIEGGRQSDKEQRIDAEEKKERTYKEKRRATYERRRVRRMATSNRGSAPQKGSKEGKEQVRR